MYAMYKRKQLDGIYTGSDEGSGDGEMIELTAFLGPRGEDGHRLHTMQSTQVNNSAWVQHGSEPFF